MAGLANPKTYINSTIQNQRALENLKAAFCFHLFIFLTVSIVNFKNTHTLLVSGLIQVLSLLFFTITASAVKKLFIKGIEFEHLLISTLYIGGVFYLSISIFSMILDGYLHSNYQDDFSKIKENYSMNNMFIPNVSLRVWTILMFANAILVLSSAVFLWTFWDIVISFRPGKKITKTLKIFGFFLLFLSLSITQRISKYIELGIQENVLHTQKTNTSNYKAFRNSGF